MCALSSTGWLSSSVWWSLKTSRPGPSPPPSTSSSELRPTSRNSSSSSTAQTPGAQQPPEDNTCTTCTQQRSVTMRPLCLQDRCQLRAVEVGVLQDHLSEPALPLQIPGLCQGDFEKNHRQSDLTVWRRAASSRVYEHGDVILPSPSHR